MKPMDFAITASLILLMAYVLSGCTAAHFFAHCIKTAASCN